MLKNILKNRNLLTLLISVFVFGLIFVISYLGIFYSLDKNLQNYYYRIKTNLVGSNISKELIIVEIDEKTLDTLGAFPFDRKIYAPFIDNLYKAGASVVAFDIIFEDYSNPVSDKIFSNSIKNSKNVIFGLSLGDDNSLKTPLKILDNYLLTKGYLRPNIDKKTNTIYSIIPSSNFGGLISEHFSIVILKAYYSYIYNNNFTDFIFGEKNNNYYLTPTSEELTPKIIKIPFAHKTKNDFLISNNKEKEVLINYVDRNKFTNVSFSQIYSQNEFNTLQEKINFKDKIIIVGTTAKGIKDTFNTPTGIEYGVYIHANMINTVLTKSFLVYFNKNIEWILVILLIIVSVYFNLSRSGYILIFSNFSIVLLFLIIFPIIVLSFTNLVINYTVELIFALIFSLSFSNVIKYLIENKHKLKLNKALSEYVSGDIAEEILYGSGKINLNGEEKRIVIFFSDIKGFTSISEKLTPKKLVSFLREYLTKMSDLIIDEKGFINKYEGDSILALWGVFGEHKDLCYKACISAINQQKLLKNLNKKRVKDGSQEIKTRMGIHIGNAIIGNIGSLGKKIEFTALGDSVNLASRLEGVNKYYGTNICVSEDIYNETKDIFEFRYLDKIKVKGKEIGIKIYELIDEKGKINEMQKDMILKFQNAVKMYLERDFTNAMNVFIGLERFGDGPSTTYIKRCENYIETPPSDDWDGIWIMENK